MKSLFRIPTALAYPHTKGCAGLVYELRIVLNEGRQAALRTRRLRIVDQFLKKSSVVNHGLAKIFRACLTACLTKRGFVRGAVIVENHRVIHGDIRDALLEVGHRIAARGHHVDEQLVGFCDCASRTVNKACLDSGPTLDKSSAIGGSEWTDVQALHALGSLVQHCFRFPLVSTFFYGSGVFSSAKLVAQPFCAAFPNREQNHKARCKH
jgi:hypothetical protein